MTDIFLIMTPRLERYEKSQFQSFITLELFVDLFYSASVEAIKFILIMNDCYNTF
jgi:hypothetical protein